jgi:hypothetical protein
MDDDDNSPMFVQFDEYVERNDIKLSGPLHVTNVPPPLVENLKERFLKLFAQCGLAEEACKQMGLSPGTVYLWRNEDDSFAERWDNIRHRNLLPLLEEKAFKLVLETDKPNPLMLMFLMKAYNRGLYDEKFTEPERSNAITVNIVDVTSGRNLSDEAKREKLIGANASSGTIEAEIEQPEDDQS